MACRRRHGGPSRACGIRRQGDRGARKSEDAAALLNFTAPTHLSDAQKQALKLLCRKTVITRRPILPIVDCDQ
nr:hypothetical protein [Rhizobium anhuiense]